VFIHELGHFSIAKLFGVKIYVFSIGFGKQLITKYYKGTQWSLSLIPLGGYVKMKGQEDLDPALVNNDPDSYNSKTPLQRILILFAGPFANFVLAFFLYVVVALLGYNYLSPTIGQVIKNSPASQAGIKKGDIILQINQHKIAVWDDIGKIIRKSNSALQFKIKRNNTIVIKTIQPTMQNSVNIYNEKIKKRMIGIAPAPKIITIKYSFLDSFVFAYDKTIQSSKMIFVGIQKLLAGIVPANQIGGVVSIGKVVADASNNGIVALFTIMALISVNLGVLNLLPIPALDGGHIMFNLYEMITGKKPSSNMLIRLTIIGWVILASLMLLGLYNDINRLLG
jgi:regulator of sigma E protease